MKVVLAILISIHAAAHLPGFMSAFGLSKMAMSRAVTPVAGLLWGAACIMFFVAAGLLIMDKSWGYLGVFAIVLSQVLVIVWWRDARLGTIVNFIVLFPAVVNVASLQFRAKAHKEAVALLNKNAVVNLSNQGYANLPLPVKRWLDASGALHANTLHTLRLKQKGKLRMEPGGKWFPVEAEQYFNVDSPSFVWLASIDGGVYSVAGKDIFDKGKGRMNIRALSLLTVADARGPEMDQGTMLRYLAEVQWFPQAALCPFITWEGIDDTTVRARFSVGGKTVEGFFYFNEQGDITRFEAKRYMEKNGVYSLETWSVPVTAYAVFDGVRVPSRGNTIWKLKDGDFNWFRWEVTEISYNSVGTY